MNFNLKTISRIFPEAISSVKAKLEVDSPNENNVEKANKVYALRLFKTFKMKVELKKTSV